MDSPLLGGKVSLIAVLGERIDRSLPRHDGKQVDRLLKEIVTERLRRRWGLRASDCEGGGDYESLERETHRRAGGSRRSGRLRPKDLYVAQ